MLSCKGTLYLICLTLLVASLQSERPQLTNNRVLPLEATVESKRYEYLLTTLEFDQDLYVNEAFVCAGQEVDCTPSACVPCDWSGESPTGCDNPNCCGPAQWPAFPASNYTSEWCDSSLPPYTKLEFNEPSEVFSLKEGEYKYFRFFIGEEEYCRNIHIEVTVHYGDMSLVTSSFVAYPNEANINKIDNGQQFKASRMYRSNPQATYAQRVLTLCPNVNPAYERGTNSIALLGLHPRSVASVTIRLGEDRYPIAPPEDRIRCEDVPDDIYSAPPYISPPFYPWTGNMCLEEGITTSFNFPRREWFDVVLPVRPGCQEISFTFNGFTNTDTEPINPDQNLFVTCGVSTDFADPNNLPSALISRSDLGIGTWYISACFEEVTYLHCSMQTIFPTGKSMLYWSTEAKPIRRKLSEVNPGMLTTYYGKNKAGALFRELNYDALGDWGFGGWSWLTQSWTNPLVFYPPTYNYAYDFTEDPIQPYIDAGFSETKSNIVNIVDYTTVQNNALRSRETLLEKGFIYVMGITNVEGEPVDLCSDNDFERGECERGSPLTDTDSWTEFLTTRTFSTMNIVEEPECNEDSYYKQQDLVQRKVKSALQSSTIDEISQAAYLSDLYNAALARTACVMTIENVLESNIENVSRVEEGYCPYEPNDPNWSLDPCCNERAEAVFCCAPQKISEEEDLYTEADIVDIDLICANPDCDESFFTDIAASLNAIGNPLTGCASGLGEPEYELDVLIEKAMAEFIRPCLVRAGYGDTFEGVKCVKNADCDFMGTSCNKAKGICRLHSTQETRDLYYDCFFENMPPMVEDYIRRNVLDPVDADFPRDSKYFQAAVRSAATKTDCVAFDPLDLSYGERWAADSALACKGEGLGFRDLALIEANEAMITEICPEYLCLGERACRFPDAKTCKTPAQVGTICLDTYHAHFPPSELSCPTTETVCSVSPPLPSPSSSCNEDEYQCVLCLDEWDSCTVVEGVDTEEECERLVACETPDGGIRYDLTEDECLNFGECTSDCDGPSCRSVEGKKGACMVEVPSDQCLALGGVEEDGECFLGHVDSEDKCNKVAIELSVTAEWYRCETLDIDSCNDHANFTAPYKYLRCFVDIFRTCETEDECLATGSCSDVEVTKNVIPDAITGWFSVTYGTCLSSGTKGFFTSDEPVCTVNVGEDQFKYGCRFTGVSDGLCFFYGSPSSFLAPHWTVWLTPARTEETCRQEVQGRYGCALPKDYEKTYWFYNSTDCECKQGTGDFLYSWTPGSWERGTPHPLTWTNKELRPKYTWEDTYSLVEMESWVRNAVESSFVYVLKSQLVCETNYLSSSLTTLVCDCVGDGERNGASCFPQNIETEVGIIGACAGEVSVLKGPSSFSTFYSDSIFDLCTEATLSLIQRSWFLFPRSSSSISFRFAERKQQGEVLNMNGADVGEIMGDGSNIIFEKPERVNYFSACLLLSEDEEKYSEKYPVRDFGVPMGDYVSILPLGLKNVEEQRDGLFIYWCANVSSDRFEGGDGIALFPVMRIEEFEDEEGDSLSHQTESLLYTLAACYILDLIFCVVFVVVMVYKNVVVESKELPTITWLGVIFGIVCVFRIAFCFVYIDDGFSELSEYVIFEIPTFLLFTAVILVIGLFMRLSKRNTFDFKSQDKNLILVGILTLVFVWSLFIVVTVVYSEVILEEDDTSICPGRVQSDDEDIEDDTRTLSIVYQTIVIVLTLIFALVFAKQAVTLFKMSKNSSQNAKIFIFRLGAIIVTSFFLRCILFIILLAIDLISDIYLFITLFLTEVVMILLISLELNKGFYQRVAGVVTSKTVTGTGGSRDQSSGTKNTGSTQEM